MIRKLYEKFHTAGESIDFYCFSCKKTKTFHKAPDHEGIFGADPGARHGFRCIQCNNYIEISLQKGENICYYMFFLEEDFVFHGVYKTQSLMFLETTAFIGLMSEPYPKVVTFKEDFEEENIVNLSERARNYLML